jgi:hypothetical protein
MARVRRAALLRPELADHGPEHGVRLVYRSNAVDLLMVRIKLPKPVTHWPNRGFKIVRAEEEHGHVDRRARDGRNGRSDQCSAAGHGQRGQSRGREDLAR